MVKIGYEIDSEDENKATNFHAETRLQFLRDVMPFNGQYTDMWCVCFISFNAITNMSLVRLANNLHVECNIHKLKLAVISMINAHPDLTRTICSVHATMKDDKQQKCRFAM